MNDVDMENARLQAIGDRKSMVCFLPAAFNALTELRERDIHDARLDQARELIRQVLSEQLVDQCINELGISDV